MSLNNYKVKVKKYKIKKTDGDVKVYTAGGMRRMLRL